MTVREAAREPLIAYNRKDYPEAHEMLETLFAGIKEGPRVVEEHDSVSALIAAVEAGNGAAVAVESLACAAGERLKLIPFMPEPAPLSVGAVWSKAGLPEAGSLFLKCAREAASK